MLDPPSADTNYLIITIDSCRWDAFVAADTPTLESVGDFRKAFAQATYTYPAHLSIYNGILPDTREPVPYYNRFCTNLFRIQGRNALVNSYVTFPPATRSIIEGFEAQGLRTIGCAALDWFAHPNLCAPFQVFRHTGINIGMQTKWLLAAIAASEQPFFALLNIGETHEPYQYGGQISPSLASRARMRAGRNLGFLDDEFQMQIAALEYVDKHLDRLFHCIGKKFRHTVVAVCADHGECFGEEGFYGHGFYHPKIMEVPLAIFQI